jgi:methylated-DNA-[protein]-cysteine S-methyltransferase
MKKDVVYSKDLNRYLVIEYEGDTVRRIDIEMKDPGIKPQGSAISCSIKKYLETGVDDFSTYKLDLAGMTQFERAVLDTIHKIPAGETMTYAEVACAVGKPNAARAVGNVMAKNPIPLILPCHRVLASHGLGGFGGGLDMKEKLLRLEGAL